MRLRHLARALLLAMALLTGTGAGVAQAHPMSTSAVLLDVESDRVDGEVQLPIDRLAVALGREITPAQAGGALRTQLERYTRQHIAATGEDGARWAVRISDGRVTTVDGTPHLVMDLRMTPPGGEVTRFDLRYDVIIEQLVTHKAIATIRTQWKAGTTDHDPQTLGIFDFSRHSIEVDATKGSWLRGFTTMAGLGTEHVSAGADHLLFLLMLLIPAPLIARGGRWRRRDSAKGSVLRVVHVVTAFAVGHSITLALATFDVVSAPSQVVESLIALSILISALHVIRPLVPGGEAIIALGFGLVHGMAFATILSDFGLTGGTLVSSLLGFNLGIEITQLLVVALMMPSLYVLSRTRVYPTIRIGAGLFGVVLSTAWLLDRASVIGSDPFESFSTSLVEHPFTVAATFAVLAAIATTVSRTRGTDQKATTA